MDIDITGKLNDWILFTYKKLFGLFSRKAEICRTWKINASYILSSSAKSCWVYTIIIILLICIDLSIKQHQHLWFNQTHLPLFQIYISTEIYIDFFLSSGGYNFKSNYLKDKMRSRMWAHMLLNSLLSSPLQSNYYFWYRRSKCYEKTIKFYQEIFFCAIK